MRTASSGAVLFAEKAIYSAICRKFHEIEDSIIDAACTAQYNGFEVGFRYGIELMQGIMGMSQQKARAAS